VSAYERDEPADLTEFARSCRTRKTNAFGKPLPPWKAPALPEVFVRFKQARLIKYEQNSYSDDSFFAVPYEGRMTPAAQKRLREFVRRGDTHTGWAGSGSSWDVSEVRPAEGGADGGVVVIHARHSISD
jgi:hypothetical protein